MIEYKLNLSKLTHWLRIQTDFFIVFPKTGERWSIKLLQSRCGQQSWRGNWSASRGTGMCSSCWTPFLLTPLDWWWQLSLLVTSFSVLQYAMQCKLSTRQVEIRCYRGFKWFAYFWLILGELVSICDDRQLYKRQKFWGVFGFWLMICTVALFVATANNWIYLQIRIFSALRKVFWNDKGDYQRGASFKIRMV